MAKLSEYEVWIAYSAGIGWGSNRPSIDEVFDSEAEAEESLKPRREAFPDLNFGVMTLDDFLDEVYQGGREDAEYERQYSGC